MDNLFEHIWEDRKNFGTKQSEQFIKSRKVNEDRISEETCPVCGSKETTFDSKQAAYHCSDCSHWFDGSGVVEHPIDCNCKDDDKDETNESQYTEVVDEIELIEKLNEASPEEEFSDEAPDFHDLHNHLRDDIDTEEETESDEAPEENEEPAPELTEPEEESDAQKEEEQIEKVYIGKSGDTFYYLNQDDKGKLNVTDAEGKIVFPKADDEEEVKDDGTGDSEIGQFIRRAAQKLDMTEMAASAIERFFEPARSEQEKELDKQDGLQIEDENEEEIPEEEGQTDEEGYEEEGEKPITIESKIIESKINEVKVVFDHHEFDVQMKNDSEAGTIISINNKQDFNFTPAFTRMFRDKTNKISEENLKELALDALANLTDEAFEKLAQGTPHSDKEIEESKDQSLWEPDFNVSNLTDEQLRQAYDDVIDALGDLQTDETGNYEDVEEESFKALQSNLYRITVEAKKRGLKGIEESSDPKYDKGVGECFSCGRVLNLNELGECEECEEEREEAGLEAKIAEQKRQARELNRKYYPESKEAKEVKVQIDEAKEIIKVIENQLDGTKPYPQHKTKKLSVKGLVDKAKAIIDKDNITEEEYAELSKLTAQMKALDAVNMPKDETDKHLKDASKNESINEARPDAEGRLDALRDALHAAATATSQIVLDLYEIDQSRLAKRFDDFVGSTLQSLKDKKASKFYSQVKAALVAGKVEPKDKDDKGKNDDKKKDVEESVLNESGDVPKIGDIYIKSGVKFKVMDLEPENPTGSDLLFGEIILQPLDGGLEWPTIKLGDFFENGFKKLVDDKKEEHPHATRNKLHSDKPNPDEVEESINEDTDTAKIEPFKNDTELASAIRKDIMAEQEAIALYQTQADATDNEQVKKLLIDIGEEEQVHVGELTKLLSMIQPKEKDLNDKGEEEAEGKMRDGSEDLEVSEEPELENESVNESEKSELIELATGICSACGKDVKPDDMLKGLSKCCSSEVTDKAEADADVPTGKTPEQDKEASEEPDDIAFESKVNEGLDLVSQFFAWVKKNKTSSREAAIRKFSKEKGIDASELRKKLRPGRSVGIVRSVEGTIPDDKDNEQTKIKKLMEMSTYTRAASTDEQERAIGQVERTLKKLGKHVCGGTTIGKSPQTVILDLTHQGSEVYVDSDGDVTINNSSVDPDNTDDVRAAVAKKDKSITKEEQSVEDAKHNPGRKAYDDDVEESKVNESAFDKDFNPSELSDEELQSIEKELFRVLDAEYSADDEYSPEYADLISDNYDKVKAEARKRGIILEGKIEETEESTGSLNINSLLESLENQMGVEDIEEING